VTNDKNSFKELCPVQGCSRHQFMTFIIRSASRKYKLEPKLNISYSETVQKFIEEFEDKLVQYNPTSWRWDK